MTTTAVEQVKALVDSLTPDEQLRVLDHVVRRLRLELRPSQAAEELYGIWRGRFPADFDLDAELRGIRGAREREWPTGKQ
jgi:hypothetical protein